MTCCFFHYTTEDTTCPLVSLFKGFQPCWPGITLPNCKQFNFVQHINHLFIINTRGGAMPKKTSSSNSQGSSSCNQIKETSNETKRVETPLSLCLFANLVFRVWRGRRLALKHALSFSWLECTKQMCLEVQMIVTWHLSTWLWSSAVRSHICFSSNAIRGPIHNKTGRELESLTRTHHFCLLLKGTSSWVGAIFATLSWSKLFGFLSQWPPQ